MSDTQENKTKHFKPTVPQDLRDKLLLLAEAVKEDYFDNGGFNEITDATVEEISGVPYSGFFPFQDGGFQISAFDTDNPISNSNGYTPKQTKWNEFVLKCCREEFLEHKGLKTQYTVNGYSFEPELPEDLNGEYQEYEADYLSNGEYEALLRLRIWVELPNNGYFRNATETKITVEFSIGYSDTPYYREEHDESIFKHEMTLQEILDIEAKDFIKMINEKEQAGFIRAHEVFHRENFQEKGE